jgi:hypothetical protein
MSDDLRRLAGRRDRELRPVDPNLNSAPAASGAPAAGYYEQLRRWRLDL